VRGAAGRAAVRSRFEVTTAVQKSLAAGPRQPGQQPRKPASCYQGGRAHGRAALGFGSLDGRRRGVAPAHVIVVPGLDAARALRQVRWACRSGTVARYWERDPTFRLASNSGGEGRWGRVCGGWERGRRRPAGEVRGVGRGSAVTLHGAAMLPRRGSWDASRQLGRRVGPHCQGPTKLMANGRSERIVD
jgi:hypothetical protein